MSNSRANMEIMDVLSSIRRLVSEDRSTALSRTPDPGPDKTDAAPVADADPASSAAEMTADPAIAGHDLPEPDLSVGNRLPGESRFVLTAALRVGEDDENAATGDDGPDPEDDQLDLLAAPGPARDMSSLEDTIAELEAAVAGIEEDFEPDGGDETPHAELAPVRPMPAWPVQGRATAEPTAFQGIMAGFDAMPAAPDDRLDQPINGDLTLPAARRGDDRPAAAAGAGLFHRAASRMGGAMATPPEDPVADAPEAMSAEPAGAGDTTVADDLDSSSLVFAESDVEAPVVPSRPVILRARPLDPGPAGLPDEPGQEDADGADSLSDAVSDAGSPTDISASDDPDDDLTSATDRLISDESDEETDLFDPLAMADLDIETLRDMVTEIIRDELRGTLGERITRNLRVLVRREIERVLIAEGLKRG